jgi:hypothetical protein
MKLDKLAKREQDRHFRQEQSTWPDSMSYHQNSAGLAWERISAAS